MKKTVISLVALVLALPMEARTRRAWTHAVSADPVVLTAEPIPDGVNAALRVMSQLRAAAQQKKSQSIRYNGSGRAVLIPAAGSVRGGNGTFFRSDITFVNWNDGPQTVMIMWMPNGASAPEVFKTSIPGDRPPFTIQDFVGATLGRTGLGALFFVPITATNVPDIDDAAVDVFSRIWTLQPNATGTVSQPFPGVDPDNLTGEYEAFILGLRQDASYRTNVGIVNLNSYPLDFVITVFPEAAAAGTKLQEIAVTVPPLSMIQRGLDPTKLYDTPVNIAVNVDEDVADDGQSWAAYASSTDNTTGDGWVSIAARDYGDDELDFIGLSHKQTKRDDK